MGARSTPITHSAGISATIDPLMGDDPDRGEQGERPQYTLYRSGSGRGPRSGAPPRPRAGDAAPNARRASGSGDGERPSYTLYRSGPRLLSRLRGGDGGLRPPRSEKTPRDGRRRLTWRRGLAYVALALGGWLVLSLILFLVSAQLERRNVSPGARAALTSSGFPLTSANTILVLGSDRRPRGTREPGALGGPSRSDTIMLLRVGGGHSARLSIPRDTVVPIPGHGSGKINAAYAYGGPRLAIRTVEDYLGVRVNHLVLVSFTNFPAFIDALGGIDFTVGKRCVRSLISGGNRNGGYTLYLHHGSNHLSGKEALALARTRHNSCDPNEDDLTRVRRQQQILAAIRGRLTSPLTFFRLPWVAWTAPKTIQTDMGGFSLLGLFAGIVTAGSPPTRVLRPSADVTLSDGERGLTVSPAQRRAAVRRFLRG